MNNTTLRCLWLSIVLAMFANLSVQATPREDTLSSRKTTKEVIVVNYDHVSNTDMNQLAMYAHHTYESMLNGSVVIKDYSDENNVEHAKTLKLLISSLTQAGISSKNIIISKEEKVDASAYFSITISSSSQVQ